MSFKLPTKYALLATLVLILATFFGGWILGHKRADNASHSQLNALNGQIHTLTVQLHDTKVYVAEKQQEIISLKEAIRNGNIEREELRKLNLKKINEITRLNLQIDTLLKNVTHNGQVIELLYSRIANYKPDSVANITHKAILLPFMFDKSDEWISLKGNFDKDGKLDVGLKLKFGVDLWAGIDKITKKNKAVLTTTCPYVKTVSFNSIKFDLPRTKRYGIGLQLGWGVGFGNPIRSSPYLGVGVSYNFIRF